MTELHQLPARTVVAQLKTGDITAHDALDALEARIKVTDDVVNALPTLCFERAHEHTERAAALPTSQRGLLCGLPVAIKDLLPVAGVRTTFGSAIYRDHIPAESAPQVTQIETHGGIVYAKSNTPEFGAGGITFNDVFGKTRNPRDLRLSAGGSSGGAAAALACGSAWLAHGSDMAGSLRTPAGFCGVASLRPSVIRAESGCIPCELLSAEGPMARDVRDLALFADVMLGGDMQRAAEMPTSPARVAVSFDLGVTEVSDEVADVFQQLIATLEKENLSIAHRHPDLSGAHECFDVLRAQSFAVNLKDEFAEHRALLKPEVVWNVETGLSLGAQKIEDAIQTQEKIVNRATTFMREFDLLICPATSLAKVSADLRYPGSDSGVAVPEYYRWLAIVYAITVTGLPVITLPCGETADGLPVGVQLIGGVGGEYNLFRYARMLEKMIGRSCAPVDLK